MASLHIRNKLFPNISDMPNSSAHHMYKHTNVGKGKYVEGTQGLLLLNKKLASTFVFLV